MPKQLVKFATIIVLILFSTSLNAQVDSIKADKGVNINFFNGYAISYKWNASQSMSYRVYLNLSSSWWNDKYDKNDHYYDGSPKNSTLTNDRKYVEMDLSFQFLFNIISKKSFNFYSGIGPNLSYGFSENESTSKTEGEDKTYRSVWNSITYGIGVISLVGIEAHLSTNTTLFAETHFSIKKSWENSKSNNSSRLETSTTDTVWRADLDLVKVGLGIYF